jgi:hypothetical protein
MMDRSEWARQVVGDNKATQDAERVRQEKVVSDRKLIAAKSAEGWAALRSSIMEYSKAINEVAGSNSIIAGKTNPNQIVIKSTDRPAALCSVVFNPNDATIRTTILGTLKPIINSEEDLVWKISNEVFNPDQIAAIVVQHAWDSRNA